MSTTAPVTNTTTAEADQTAGIGQRNSHRSVSPLNFYTDFATANFGSAVGSAAARVLAGMDGPDSPQPVTWDMGPGVIQSEETPWAQIQSQYAFVEKFAVLRPDVFGAANLERFDYWLNTLRYFSSLAEVGCARGQLDLVMKQVRLATDPESKLPYAQRALTNRIVLARAWDRMMSHLVSTVRTPGELGTVANLHQQNLVRRQFLTTYDTDLVSALGSSLPPSVDLATTYAGPSRLIVPAVRTLVEIGESLIARAMLITSTSIRNAPIMRWRWLGGTDYQSIPMTSVGGANFRAILPPATNDLEY